jgi:predicted flap endonuclease-1-like 5' DNA nuclease
MFKETITSGPGQYTIQDYTIEIIIILVISFLFGYVFRLLLNSNFKKKIKKLQMELDLAKSEMANRDNTSLIKTYEAQVESDKKEINTLRVRVNDLVKEKLDLQSAVNKLNVQLTAQKSEVDFLNNKINKVLKKDDAPRTNTKKSEDDNNTNLKSAASNPKVGGSDLKKIEGIGPRIEQILNNGNIFSYEDLMNADISELKNLLNRAGPTYAVHDPNTWPEQAKLAFNNNWTDLDALQKELKAGKRVR